MLDGFLLGLDFWKKVFLENYVLILLIVLFLIVFSTIAFLVQFVKNQKIKRSGILDIDKMKGKEFEHYLLLLFSERGYKVIPTKSVGDYGADLVLKNANKKIVVQAKRYKKKVGLKAVQEVVSAKNYYQADECWVVTNNYFTQPAINLAKVNAVMLVDRDQLIKMILELKKQKTA